MSTTILHNSHAATLSANNKSPRERSEAAALPRIAILDHTAALGGGEIALLEFTKRLDLKKFDPTVILFSLGPLCDRLSDASVQWEVIALDSSISNTRKGALGLNASLILQLPKLAVGLFSAMRFVFRLSRHLKKQKFTIVHTNSLKSDILGGFAARLAGIPVIWHIRDRISDDYLPPAAVKLFRLLCRWVPTHIIANSNATRATLSLPTPGALPKLSPRQKALLPLGTIHDGTDITPANITTAPISPISKETTIGLVGRITPWKGQHIFIQAAAQVLKQFPTAKFQLIGSALFDETAYYQQIRQQVQTLGIADSVHFLGFRTDVPSLISKLTILVHASTTGEPFGQVIIEGMAKSKPIIATNGGGVPEIVVDGITGILVPMDDADAMGNAMLKLLSDAPLIERMGRAGGERVKSCFAIERTVERIERVYGVFGGLGQMRLENACPASNQPDWAK